MDNTTPCVTDNPAPSTRDTQSLDTKTIQPPDNTSPSTRTTHGQHGPFD